MESKIVSSKYIDGVICVGFLAVLSLAGPSFSGWMMLSFPLIYSKFTNVNPHDEGGPDYLHAVISEPFNCGGNMSGLQLKIAEGRIQNFKLGLYFKINN